MSILQSLDVHLQRGLILSHSAGTPQGMGIEDRLKALLIRGEHVPDWESRVADAA